MAEGEKRIFTGLQPSGQLHIGNYFGALRPMVDMFEVNHGLIMVADYHALTTVKDPAVLRENILSVTRDYLAAGINLSNAIIFKQSDVPEHTELAWIFETLVTVPFLQQAHAYKDKVAKGLEANAGLFNYPMLMAADILLYDTDIVPVGQDQRQHVEYAREAAAKFNNAYGVAFKEPEEKISDVVAVVPGTDGQKMSKSYGNIIPLFGSKDEIAKAVMSIVTDSGETHDEAVERARETPDQAIFRQGISFATNLFAIHKLFRDEIELIPMYNTFKNSYKTLKENLIEDIEALVAPMRQRRAQISDEEVKKVLRDGAQKARAIASAKMKIVREKIGVSL